jgi:hypothetical protein
MLNVTYKPFMLNVIMLNVIMLNVIMLNIIMLNVIMLNVIMPNVVATLLPSLIFQCEGLCRRLMTYPQILDLDEMLSASNTLVSCNQESTALWILAQKISS